MRFITRGQILRRPFRSIAGTSAFISKSITGFGLSAEPGAAVTEGSATATASAFGSSSVGDVAVRGEGRAAQAASYATDSGSAAKLEGRMFQNARISSTL